MNSTWVDYYEALELEFGCSEEEIKKNYRTLMKKYHPDSEFADDDKAREVNNAYEVLGDEEKRAEYDSTYWQYKNGEFAEEQTDEMPKYTHEEMNEAFTEEEIRFAKRVALQQTISETLENAKIIIDAKNELLFAAFNDAYDEDTYCDEYREFCAITKDFIANLNDLIVEAHEYDLDAEVTTINQVIDFLVEVMESIPESLKEAKRKVKLEIMKEQLQGEANQAIANAEAVREEFISLYSKVYRENIGKDDFKMYYNMLRLGVTDALSQLASIYDLLKKAGLDEEYKNVGILIGKLNQDLKLYTGKYKVAQAIGKREDLKMRIKDSMLTFTEYKVKMLNIMQEIIQNPTLDNAKLRVTEGRVLTKEFKNKFVSIDKKEYEESIFTDSAKELYKDAVKIFNNGLNLHKKLKDIFNDKEWNTVRKNYVELLVEDAEMTEESVEAVKLLREAYILLGQHNEYKEITKDDLKKLIKQVNGYMSKSEELQNYLEVMLGYIDKIVEAYNNFGGNQEIQKVLNGLKPRDLSSKLDFYRASAAILRAISLFAVGGIMGYTLINGDHEVMHQFQIASESFSVPEDMILAGLTSLGSFIPLRLIAGAISSNASVLADKLLIYRGLAYSEQKYDSLVNGRDSYLNDIYQRALKI